MGKVRIGKVKGVSNEIVNKYGSAFTTDFSTNKKLVYQYSDIRSKHLNNRVAGYVTRLLVSRKKREEALKLEEAEIASQESAAAPQVEVPEITPAGSEPKEIPQGTEGSAETEKSAGSETAAGAEEEVEEVEEGAKAETDTEQGKEPQTSSAKPSEAKD